VKYELVACIEDFHRVLSRYSGQDIVSPGKIPDISPIKERKGQQTEVITQSDGWDSEPSYEVRPAIDEVPYSYLQDIAGQLEAAAGKPTGGRQLPNPSKLSDDGPAGGVDDREQRAAAADFEQSNFFRSLYKDVEGDRGGGAIIIVDAEDARTGVGKTGAACGPIAFPDVTDDSDLYQAIKAQKDKLQETDSLDAGDLVEDETDTDSEDAGPDLHKIADEVADNVDAYTSVHGGNGTTYLDSDMIELEHDLSIRKAEKVKKLVERKGVEI